MSVLSAGAMIGILGGGQLGRMLAGAAAQLGFNVSIFCPETDCPAARVAAAHTIGDYTNQTALLAWAKTCDVVTYEFENVPVAAAEALIDAGVLVRPGAKPLEVSQDRVAEKSFLQSAGIATADFASIDHAADVDDAIKRFGEDGYFIGDATLVGETALSQSKDRHHWHPSGRNRSRFQQYSAIYRQQFVKHHHLFDGLGCR